MAGEGTLGDGSLGNIAHALGKIEKGQEEGDKQRAKLFESIDSLRDLVSNVRTEQATYHSRIDTVINQLVADSEDYETRISSLEKAEDQRAGAGRLARIVERVITALFGGAAAIAANRLWPHG